MSEVLTETGFFGLCLSARHVGIRWNRHAGEACPLCTAFADLEAVTAERDRLREALRFIAGAPGGDCGEGCQRYARKALAHIAPEGREVPRG